MSNNKRYVLVEYEVPEQYNENYQQTIDLGMTLNINSALDYAVDTESICPNYIIKVYNSVEELQSAEL